ncbi:CmcI family methyltransferase [Pseudomonas mosselii]|uniref:CmcI family methyltransferase n=1 Tax=Pseudomonas mosselii TaxID=78327 RepID=UPI000D95E43F|nr:CmcI family methyltransferase [Pseudomonas mosselii]PYC19671.1 hypothetical protein DMX06_15380 [Pseudomonas mosselii]
MRSYEMHSQCPVGFAKTSCNACSVEIPLSADRFHCLPNHEDFCLACTPSLPREMPGLVLYPGVKPLEAAQREQQLAEMRENLENNHTFSAAATFFSNYARAILSGNIDHLGLPEASASQAKTALEKLILLRSMGRFVDFFARKVLSGTVVTGAMHIFSQGVNEANRWKGLPLLKGVYDYALYPLMLEHIKPATIFEFGSEAGGSAVWLADLMRMFNLDCHVYSVDLVPPLTHHDKVTFVQGDARAPEQSFSADFLSKAPHPWLVIEDSHVNIGGILRHFSTHMQPGDYFIVEDENAEAEIGQHLLLNPNQYRVDTFFTDYFGYNATCSPDQILAFMPA